MKNLFIRHKEELEDLLRYGVLRAEELENPGLYNGKLGMAIFFYEYSRYSSDALYEQFADEIMDSVLTLPDSLSFRFSDGLTGIGWGITYLLKEGYIEGDLDDILSEVDMKLMGIDSQDEAIATDRSIYLSIRGNYIKQNEKEQVYDSVYSEDKIVEQIWKNCFYQINKK